MFTGTGGTDSPQNCRYICMSSYPTPWSNAYSRPKEAGDFCSAKGHFISQEYTGAVYTRCSATSSVCVRVSVPYSCVFYQWFNNIPSKH